MRAFAAAALLLGACANPGPVQLSPGVYMISREDHAGIFGSASGLKAGVIADANQFAARQGRVAVPVSSRETPVGQGMGQWAKFEYQFGLVEKGDPRANGVSLLPRPDFVIEKTEKISGDIRTKDESMRPKDVYAELIKLDDLRKRAILTDAEFEAQKNKLLMER